ncbi:hypothetical protein NQD34_003487 [Periophthalmus magnuspinnatus]|nr:hypothetical protein NQD34_003487 [Periophthalmus magnuspinnatus]
MLNLCDNGYIREAFILKCLQRMGDEGSTRDEHPQIQNETDKERQNLNSQKAKTHVGTSTNLQLFKNLSCILCSYESSCKMSFLAFKSSKTEDRIPQTPRDDISSVQCLGADGEVILGVYFYILRSPKRVQKDPKLLLLNLHRSVLVQFKTRVTQKQ